MIRSSDLSLQSAFVTGATGLLGSNLVRMLVDRGIHVRALARSREKAAAQLAGLANVEIVHGDLANVAGFEPRLSGSDVVFHCAAYFRESYTGGRHEGRLMAINVDGTRALLEAAYRQGVRRAVVTSSVAVLEGGIGETIDETMLRPPERADAYFRSKILAERAALDVTAASPGLSLCFVLPGWMHGPWDAGPTSAGQLTLDFLRRRLPGVPRATFSLVDARDVANAHLAAAERGASGERYLAAGRDIAFRDLLALYERLTGIPAPRRSFPTWLLYLVGAVGEVSARIWRRPALISLAGARLIVSEAGRTNFDSGKACRELGVRFRPMVETLKDEIAWMEGREPAQSGP